MLRRVFSSASMSSSRLFSPTAVMTSSSSRHFSSATGGSGESSILGTSTLTPEFLDQFRAEVLDQTMIAEEEKQVGGIFSSCIRKGEMDHMESPAADNRQLKRLDKQVDNLFASIPEPKDPMRAARRPTQEELEDNEKFEALKDIMRERYQRQNSRRKAETERIDAAMQAVEEGTYEEKFQRNRMPPVYESAEELRAAQKLAEPENMEKLKLMQELQETKQQMRKLKAQLEEQLQRAKNKQAE